MEALDTKIVVALIAVFVSFIGLIISKEQKTSEFRQAWINTLRDDVSKFIGQIDKVKKLVLINKIAKEDKKEETSNNVILGSTEMRELQSKIALLINPKEKNHTRMVKLIDEIIINIQQQQDHSQNIKLLTELSQQILKEEWNRVKKGEPIFKLFKYVFGMTTVGVILYSIYKILLG